MVSFKELKLKRVYRSLGEEQLNRDFVIPVLNHTKLYKRGTAFFSSFSLGSVLNGVEALYLNGGHMQLVVSPQLSKEDIDVIKKASDKIKAFGGYVKDKIDSVLFELSDNYFELFYNLLVSGTIEIKFALTYTRGIYHDKVAVFEDNFGNKLSFSGSANESKSAYEENYERVKIFSNYESEESNEYFKDDEEEFNTLWGNDNSELDIFDASDAIKKKIIKIVESGQRTIKKKEGGPRGYQKEAINAWHKNHNNGFFVMATGTGKTYTACYCVKDVIEETNPVIIVIMPYIHLIAQWEETLRNVLNFDYCIQVYGGNSGTWKRELVTAMFGKRRNPKLKVALISTMKSFRSKYFQDLLHKYKGERLLIVDEAHRFSNTLPHLAKEDFKYTIGLSATPLKGRYLDTTLLGFFNGPVYNLPIEKALEKGFLCKYSYHPIFVKTTEEDEKRFKSVQRQIMQCFSHNELKKGCEDKLTQLILKRTRILALADNKIDLKKIESYIESCNLSDHFIVYCGDGRVLEGNERHLDFVKDVFDAKNFKMNRFTCDEQMNERIQLINLFNAGIYSGLVSIKCLDEGIDIPSIKSALILSSGDNFREFVQRRGRILRKYEGKEIAHIYDIILMPSEDCPGIAEIELRRFYEYAHLATNKDELQIQLEALISKYGINTDRIYKYFDSVSVDTLGEANEDE